MFIDAPLIPETRNINTLFDFMQDEKVHMAIVVDEYGQTVGLVTMEDILEEIVGNIFDEHDKEDTTIKKQADNAYVVDGLTELDELSKLLDIDFNTEEIDTLNGFMISKIGHVPDKGEKIEIEYEDYIFKTLKVDRNIIKKVRIVKKERLHDSKQG
jgi:putative hemolysin